MKTKRNQNSSFRRGSGVYTCSDCGKQTRETGSGESGLGYCKTCMEAAEMYNSVQDGDMTETDFYAVLANIGYQGKDFGNA